MTKIPFSFSKSHEVLLLDQLAETPTLFFSPKTKPSTLHEVARNVGPLRFCKKSSEELLAMISQEYAQNETDAATVVDELEENVDLARLMQDIPLTQDLLELKNDAPIIRMINSLFKQASRDSASDIHLEAYEKQSVVRFRVDGNLRDVVDLKRGLHAALVSRIKIMASLDIAEKRMPQDGRISLRVGSKALDIRVSTLPTAHGERVVMRLLEKNYSKLDLKTLGMAPDTEKSFLELINKPYGIVLVTGPTGSGKTTTLYSALLTLRSQVNNIMTVEDPIEYNLEGVGQTQVNSRIEMNFARALRAILRQDPDIVMIGEIRDLETAQIAVQASLTGHLVLATLHTNDAASAVTRLIDMGIEPFLLSSSLLGVLGQRLIRLTCTVCHGQGCAECTQSGFKGRAGIYELMTTSVELKELIHQSASEAQIRQKALDTGMRSLVQDSERWVRAGMTTPAEVGRVTGANQLDI
ncbi:MAG: Flp pilus assembly complex ATPase component TadA [Candidatus Methylopumilus sp.]|nr:Flp pilus assembly complex ATPase component TadA [Candidatus Methylopumilus sp.]